jgi:UDP-N-acetylmuramyl pentapeptide phosphotransferase/UDP-N-acetylglucosamine-1-phosphate transferase
MRDLALVGVSAALSAALIVALMPLLARYTLARPNARSSHVVPTPQGGGIAVVISTLAIATAGALLLVDFNSTSLWQLWSLFAAVALLAVVGGIDDIRTIEVMPRLALQFIAVTAVIAALPADLRIAASLPFWFERAAFVVAGVWLVNVVNFMDGIDWMTVVEVVAITLGICLIGLIGALPATCILVALALLGATIGFAPFNRPVAKLFLGDVGSLPIGLLLVWLLLQLAGSGHICAALLLPLYYVADATITLLRRLVNRERIMQAHRSHFYQRATERGLSVPDIIARVAVTNAVLVALAFISVWMHSLAIDIVAFALGGGAVAGLLFVLAWGKR